MLIDIRQYEKDQAAHRKAGSESSDVDGRFKMFDIDNIYNENSVRVESDLYRTFLSQEEQDEAQEKSDKRKTRKLHRRKLRLIKKSMRINKKLEKLMKESLEHPTPTPTSTSTPTKNNRKTSRIVSMIRNIIG
jgi:hypothetical protein